MLERDSHKAERARNATSSNTGFPVRRVSAPNSTTNVPTPVKHIYSEDRSLRLSVELMTSGFWPYVYVLVKLQNKENHAPHTP